MSEKIRIQKGNFIIIVLVIIAVVLGVAIYKQGSFNNLINKFAVTSIKPSETASPATTGQNSKARRPLPTDLTPDEKVLMQPPAPNDSQDKKNAHYAIAQKLAQEADILDLNKCNKPSPLDLKLVANQDFKIRNTDSVKHTLIIDSKHMFPVPANSTATFKADFGKGPGAYGYLCDDLGGVTGFFYVTPQ